MAVLNNSDHDDQSTELKRRLVVAMSYPGNEKCADCSDRRPTWGSLIMPPKNAPLDSPTLGGFICYSCAAQHRSLGTHICRVKSCTLDTCK
jgi:hypothetical protein